MLVLGCYNKNAFAGAQTERSQGALAGESCDCRRSLTGQFSFSTGNFYCQISRQAGEHDSLRIKMISRRSRPPSEHSSPQIKCVHTFKSVFTGFLAPPIVLTWRAVQARN